MSTPREGPAAAGRLLGWTSVAMLLITVTAISLISGGVFDPKPFGAHLVQSVPGNFKIQPGAEHVIWLRDLPTGNAYSLRLTANLIAGELDAGYGLALGSENEAIIFAVSPVGYTTIFVNGTGENEQFPASSLIPWQTWPHVQLDREANEIWVDVRDGEVINVRINRELLWEGAIVLEGDGLGLWMASFGGSSSVAFSDLHIFSEEQER